MSTSLKQLTTCVKSITIFKKLLQNSCLCLFLLGHRVAELASLALSGKLARITRFNEILRAMMLSCCPFCSLLTPCICKMTTEPCKCDRMTCESRTFYQCYTTIKPLTIDVVHSSGRLTDMQSLAVLLVRL